MPTTPWLYPTSGSEVARGGSSSAWSNESYITADDTNYADWGQLIAGNPIYSNYLLASGFQASLYVPSASIIKGIEVDVSRYEGGTSDDVKDSILQLYSGGFIGNNKAEDPEWGTGMQVISYGSATDLWGATLTPAIVRAAGFGVGLSVQANGWYTPKAYVDYFRMRITWIPLAVLGMF